MAEADVAAETSAAGAVEWRTARQASKHASDKASGAGTRSSSVGEGGGGGGGERVTQLGQPSLEWGREGCVWEREGWEGGIVRDTGGVGVTARVG